MSSWSVLEEEVVEPTDWAVIFSDFYAGDAESWTNIFVDFYFQDIESWSQIALFTAGEECDWRHGPLDTTKPSKGILGLSEGAENFKVKPEDVKLPPEEVQADSEDWIILPDAD